MTIFIAHINMAAAYCSDTREYVKKVHDLNPTHPELNIIKMQIQLSLQGKCLNKDTKDYVDLFVKITKSFNDIYSLSQLDIPEKHENAIKKAEDMWTDINKLEQYKEANDKAYPLLIKILLRNFFKNEAKYFSNKEKNENKTINKIWYLKYEGIAYKNIDPQKYAEISYHADEMKTLYEHDIKSITESLKEANSFIKKANESRDFFSSISLFVDGYQHEEKLNNAIQLSKNHGESQYESQAKEILETIIKIKNEKSKSVFKNMVILLIIYIIGILYIIWSILRWKNELYNANLGDNLLEGGI